jgi:hypothetical protein
MNRIDAKLNGFISFRKRNPGFPECARDVTRVAIGARLLCATLTPFTHTAGRDEEEGSSTLEARSSRWQAGFIRIQVRAQTMAGDA